MKKSQSGFIGIAIIIILAATLGGGIYYKEKINPDFLSRDDGSVSRLPIKIIDKKIEPKEDIEVKKEVAADSSVVKITPPSIPSKSVSLDTNKKVDASASAVVSSDVKVCTDAKCFIDAINACSPAKFTRSSGGEIIGGSFINTNFTFETQINSNICSIKRTLNSYKISPTEGLLEFGGGKDAVTMSEDGKMETTQQFFARFNTKSQIMVGKSDLCAKKDFIASFSTNTDYYFTTGLYECEGDLANTIKSFK